MNYNFKFWFNNARYQSLPQSVLPALLALVAAIHQPDFSLLLALVAIVGVLFGHLGINLLDDYFDYKAKTSDYRDQLAHQGIRSRIAKCEYITSGKASSTDLFIAASFFCIIALLCGVVIALFRGLPIVYIALATAVLGYSYSAKPLKLSYRGWGEIIIGIMFGPMLMIGVYIAACGTYSPSILYISIPIGLLVTNIVYSHAVIDHEADKAAKKMTFALLLRNKTAMLACSFLLMFGAFGVIVAGVLLNILSCWYLLVLVTLPMACALMYLLIQFIKYPQKTFLPKPWYGPMGDWEKYQTIGIDWFMLRWLLARNLLSFFCLILIILELFNA